LFHPGIDRGRPRSGPHNRLSPPSTGACVVRFDRRSNLEAGGERSKKPAKVARLPRGIGRFVAPLRTASAQVMGYRPGPAPPIQSNRHSLAPGGRRLRHGRFHPGATRTSTSPVCHGATPIERPRDRSRTCHRRGEAASFAPSLSQYLVDYDRRAGMVHECFISLVELTLVSQTTYHTDLEPMYNNIPTGGGGVSEGGR